MSKLLIQRESEKLNPTGWTYIKIGLRSVKIDMDDFERLKNIHWRLIYSSSCVYACQRLIVAGKAAYIRMHRLIMDCPAGFEVHHINHDTLDNRKCNLEILSVADHFIKHGKNP